MMNLIRSLSKSILLLFMRQKKNKCSKCEASFRFKKSLEKHVASVHEEKKNKCSKCDISFRFERTLKKHIVSVHEARKNICSICEASFKFMRTLKKHIVSVHGEEKPEKCLFKEKEVKKVRICSHKCLKCDLTFRFERTLKKHIASVHGEENPEKCPFKENPEKKVRSSRNNSSEDKQKYTELNSHRIDGESAQAFDSVHEEKKPDKCLLKKKVEVEEKEEKKVRNSRNQNLSDKKKYA